MRTIPAEILAQAQSRSQSAVLLLEIANWGGSTVRWSGSGEDVEYPASSGTIYDGRPLRVPDVQAGQGLAIDVANHDLAVTKLCMSNDPAGATVTLTRLWLDPSTGAHVGAEVLADGYTMQGHERADWLTLRATAPGAQRRNAPGRVYDRPCPWVFKGAECGYTGAATECDHTDATCASLGNIANFGGMLLLPPRRW